MEITFGSYNIAHGRFCDFNMARLAEDIKQSGADIVGIEEADRLADRSGNIDTLSLLAEHSGLSYYTYFKAIDIAGGEYGLGILSRFPIVASSARKLYSAHFEQRILCHAVIDLEGRPINFFVTHLSYESKAVRKKQFEFIAEKVSALDNFIIVGDFNTNDFAEYEVIRANKINSDKNFFTYCEEGDEPLSIDNIIYSDCWEFSSPKTVNNRNSDHYMLYAKAGYKK